MARIAIVGSRGIPNAYGGFEWLAEKLSAHLAVAGHQVAVCQSSRHPYKARKWGKVELLRAYDPPIGTAGQFVYDLLSILQVRRWKADVVLLLGYTSSAVWSFLLPTSARILQHMDGMEWQRDKYSRAVKAFLRRSEHIAVRHADVLIADHPVIGDYLSRQYPTKSIAYIAYGEDDLLPEEPVEPLNGKTFDLIMARMEPENQIEMLIEGWLGARLPHHLALAGSLSTRYGRRIFRKYGKTEGIVFLGGIFDKPKALWLRRHCRYYLHGHKAGGTNPSLIQALTHHRRILVHANPYNLYVAECYGLKTFDSSLTLANLLTESPPTESVVSLLSEHRWAEVYRRFEEILRN
ncbi:hypothetical protein JCM31826_13730 [Thermaurantimonas aggregans]|uniref:DUF1972 domain-containing protein n=1 Tax=Thermaurantimonas aggregans TaxID=2173829 RepID=A0A401XLM1_9FLAO|nr:DUF1972 domain-containing protein [Thermaurantimonas aggregans]MCX8149134.1 DUF1972 domain-containing protein [Thermaurantimonas aggregans]GCD77891.1 hypothetical protein JCM31826_13730 [Thermaurantimonas aggregans]